MRRDSLTILFDTRILYGNVLTYGGNGLRQLWQLIFAEGSLLCRKGLVAFGLQDAAIVWIGRKPNGLGSVTGMLVVCVCVCVHA